MATDYPDILGEYVDASKRYEEDGLQYVGQFQPDTIKIGETARLYLYLQNTLNVPIQILIRPEIPQTGRFRAKPLLSLGSSQIELALGEAEVGRLTIPVATTKDVVAGTHDLGLEFKIQSAKNATQIRKPKKSNPLKGLPVDSLIGLNLISVVGTNYSLQNGKKGKFPLQVLDQAAETSEKVGLDFEYQKIWDISAGETQHKAQIEVNKVRVQIIDDLKIEPLFANLYAETKARYLDAGLALKPGEAIALAKLLTYTSHFFLSKGELQDGLLCPIWESAFYNDYPTTDTFDLIRRVGYGHIMRLAIAFSFGFVSRVYGKQPWSDEERQGVAEYLVDALQDGEPLDVDFLYLPLMMGAVNVARQVRLPGEDVNQTMQLIKMAYDGRPSLFTAEGMEEADEVYTALLQKNMA